MIDSYIYRLLIVVKHANSYACGQMRALLVLYVEFGKTVKVIVRLVKWKRMQKLKQILLYHVNWHRQPDSAICMQLI